MQPELQAKVTERTLTIEYLFQRVAQLEKEISELSRQEQTEAFLAMPTAPSNHKLLDGKANGNNGS